MFLLLLALAPGAAIALYIYKHDKHEKEPIKLLAICFGFGALTTIPAALIEEFLFELFSLNLHAQLTYDAALFVAVFLVALPEEWVKYFVLTKYAYRKPDFNEPFDGIVYAVMIGLGFATLENILYVTQHGAGVGVMRMFTAVPMHAMCAVLMGYYVGAAKFQAPELQTKTKLQGLGWAIGMHGVYDFLLFQDESGVMTLMIIPLLFYARKLTKKAMHNHSEASPFKND